MVSGISYMINQMRKLGRPEPQFREQGEIIVVFSKTSVSAESSPRVESLLPAQSITVQNEVQKLLLPGKLQDSARDERQRLALLYIHEYGSITNKEYRAITGASENTALRDLDDLVEHGSLRGLGKRRARHYKLP